MKRPTITAVVDTYNQGRYIGEALESVLAQDVAPGEMEVLVVDDGSTDNTAERVARFGERVRYIRKENGGQASALNVGFTEARGEIIALLDADDLWLPRKVRRVLDEFEQHPEAGMVYHGYQWWNEKTGECLRDPSFRALTGYMPDRIEDVLTFGNVGTCGVALRRETIEKLIPIPERLISRVLLNIGNQAEVGGRHDDGSYQPSVLAQCRPQKPTTTEAATSVTLIHNDFGGSLSSNPKAVRMSKKGAKSSRNR